MHVENVHEAVARAAERARAGEGPTFLEFKTYRYKGHSMSDPAKYRTKEEVEGYRQRDTIENVRATILERKFATEDELAAIDERIKAAVVESVEFAEKSPFPPAEELYQDVYVQSDYPFIRE
jgi:pyruvate dehydrogenase E1 component alpha subunit